MFLLDAARSREPNLTFWFFFFTFSYCSYIYFYLKFFSFNLLSDVPFWNQCIKSITYIEVLKEDESELFNSLHALAKKQLHTKWMGGLVTSLQIYESRDSFRGKPWSLHTLKNSFTNTCQCWLKNLDLNAKISLKINIFDSFDVSVYCLLILNQLAQNYQKCIWSR